MSAAEANTVAIVLIIVFIHKDAGELRGGLSEIQSGVLLGGCEHSGVLLRASISQETKADEARD